MFGLIKNSIKTKIGIILPASYPASRISHESVSVTANGSKTIAQLFNELGGLLDYSKLTPWSIFVYNNNAGATNRHFLSRLEPTNKKAAFTYQMNVDFNVNRCDTSTVFIKPSGSLWYAIIDNQGTDYSTDVPVAGRTYTIYY